MQFIAFQTVSSTEARKQIVKEGNLFSSSNEGAFGWLVKQNISYLIPECLWSVARNYPRTCL